MLRLGRLGVVILVLVLTVGDAVLVTAALNRSHRADPSGAVASVLPPALATPNASPGQPASPSPAATATPKRQSGADVAAVTDGTNQLFTAASTTTAWRAHGGCTGKPALSRTTDGAKTWSRIKAPAPHLLRIQLTGGQGGWVVGVDSSCASPTYYGTVDGGNSWASSPTLGAVWLRLAKGVHVPSGDTTAPCGPKTASRVLAPSGTTDALTICPTGVMRTTDAGTTWKPVGRLPAGQSVAVALGGHGDGVLVLTAAPHCAGLQVLTTSDVGAKWAKGDCLTEAIEPASASLAADGSGMLVSAGRAYTTTDAGKHWS